jgi:AcrR family transcriptional regulator
MTSLSEAPADTRQRLLEGAVLLFAHKGFDGVGIRELAQKAQANSALVQYYFGGKEGLYLAAMRFLFDRDLDALAQLPKPPAPGEPDAQPRALACLQGYIRAFLGELLACPTPDRGSRELRAAGHLFWTRELMEPAPGRVEILLDHIRPYADYLETCLRVLRPDLEDEARFLMAGSIQAQILFFHRDMPMIALLRGAAYGPEDIGHLADHIAAFSLGGLGLQEPPSPERGRSL